MSGLCDRALPPPLRTRTSTGLMLSIPGQLPKLFFLQISSQIKKKKIDRTFSSQKLTIFPSTKSCFFSTQSKLAARALFLSSAFWSRRKFRNSFFHSPGKNRLEITDQLGPEVTSRNLVHHQLEALPRNRLATLMSSNFFQTTRMAAARVRNTLGWRDGRR